MASTPRPPVEGNGKPARGITCRDCGCEHFYTLETRKLDGERIWRRRECRHCGKRINTYERSFG